MGGMGLHHMFPAEGSAALFSSAALTNVAMEGTPEQIFAFYGPVEECLPQEWQLLRNHVGLEDSRAGRSLKVRVFAWKCCQKRRKTRHASPPFAVPYRAPRLGQPFEARTAARSLELRLHRLVVSTVWYVLY